MYELANDVFYEKLKNDYDELLLDYVLLFSDEKYEGKKTHEKAVKTAILLLNSRQRVGNNYKHPQFYVEDKKMEGIECNARDFFSEDNNGWIITSETTRYRDTPKYMSYWHAFSEPPYGVPYTKDDFHKINNILFAPAYRDDLEIYSWNDDFSNYFDDGKEWWGTALWSIYDKWMNRFVIIGASLTD